MMRRLVKLSLSVSLWAADGVAAAALRLIGRHAPGRLVILYYHAVPALQRARFARQMERLARDASPVPADFEGPLQPGKLHGAVTFDDGFVSVIDNALPELRKRGIPATIFVPTGYLGCAPGWIQNPDAPARRERILDPSQLRNAAAAGLVVGSHTIHHPRLDRLPLPEAGEEFRKSRQDLETILGHPVTLFSFPHGAHNPELLELARATGYRRVFGIRPTTVVGSVTGYLLGRVSTNPEDWALEFHLKLRGAYRWQAWSSMLGIQGRQ